MLNPSPQTEEGTVVLQTARGPIDVDASIAPIVAALNAAGAETIASCSGHGFRPGNIALRDGRELIIARNFEEARMIDRLFPVGGNGEIVGANDDLPVGELERIISPLVRRIDAGDLGAVITCPLSNGKRYVLMDFATYEGDLKRREVRGANKILRMPV